MRKMISFVNFAGIASICLGFHLGTLHGYFFHYDFWSNLNFPLEYQIKLVLIISDLSPYRLLFQYWLLIRNDPDALISAFPTIMIAIGLNVSESLLSITMINYYSTSLRVAPSVDRWGYTKATPLLQASGCGIVVNAHSNRARISGSYPGMSDLSSYISFFHKSSSQIQNHWFLFLN